MLTILAALSLGGCATTAGQFDQSTTKVTVNGHRLLINGKPESLFGFRVGSSALREDWTRELIAQMSVWRDNGINSITIWLQGTSGAHHRLFSGQGTIDMAPADVVSRTGYGLKEEPVVVDREPS